MKGSEGEGREKEQLNILGYRRGRLGVNNNNRIRG